MKFYLIYTIILLGCGVMENIIKIDDLTYIKNNKIILDKLCLNIEKNTWVSIIGPNASGKSTLIKILSGLLPYNGYVNIDNLVMDEYNKPEIRKNLSSVLDNFENGLVGLTVEEELSFPLQNLNYKKEEIISKITKITKAFGISHLINQNIKDITNEEKQLIMIASCLMTSPKILLLDDAIRRLNSTTKKKFLTDLKKYKKENQLTIIMVTHNLEDTLISDKIVLLNNGKKVKEGTPLSILKQEKLLKENSLEQPFMIELSQKLMLYNLIDHVYLDERKLADTLWK